MKRSFGYFAGQFFLPACFLVALGLASLPMAAAQDPAKPAAKPATKDELIAKLEKTLTGARMTGTFTVLGKEEKAPTPEEYTIVSAQKIPDGDIWLLKARVKYGTTDKTLPIPLEIQWAGDTPVITMTDMAVPGLGTFSTRVVIYDGMYSGTWQHGAVKGHLFGTITRADEKPAETKTEKATEPR
ncbi:hypothetical protein ETAA8_02740 [Anatilimnocola aggregata]|uniref:Uncharacterized protein n=1 Tax=Anatilimnocola aggregata TaxID=2528021 RepID=A0A517Y4N2_9BACT|nr:hypothetical protein [Anatilimnocola aggregata]QDU25211.1 hypothetical protein ETAA8_02740 [Anatilimnocola aggregata]